MEEQEEGRLLRKIRKKLRQIENLECIERELNEEEAAKVERKCSLRAELAAILADMKRRSNGETAEPVASAGSGSGASSPKKQRQEEDVAPPPTSSSATNLAQEEQLEISVPSTQPRESAELSVTSTTTAGAPLSSPEEFVQVRVSTPAGKSVGSRDSSSSRSRRLAEELSNREVIVNDLGGHEDLAVAVAIDSSRDIAMTGARDTRILVWKLSTREQLSSLRGHSGSVTGLVILPPAANDRFGCSMEHVIGISSSSDCCLKVWNLSKGVRVKSMYTYNGIKCLAYSEELDMIVTGTESGKLEFFDVAVEANAAVHSVKDAHEEALTAVDFSGRRVASGSRDGIVKIWEYDGKKRARVLFASEDVSAAADEHATHLRCITTLRLLPGSDDLVAYGDSGCNIKILQWKCGLLHKLPNHTGEHGFTDCLELSGDLLAASSYDVDTGQGHVNLFRVVPGQIVPSYLCSWSDEETSRIHGLGISYGGGENQLSYVTAGKEVKIWRTIKGRRDLPKNEDAIVVRSSKLPLDSADSAVDSGSSDDDEDLTDTESENDGTGRRRNRSRDGRLDEGEKTSWCTLS